jgi:hypothetical protein
MTEPVHPSDRPDETAGSSEETRPEEVRPEDLGHPRGTLAIVTLYGLLFALGWLALYLFRFLGHGAPTS